MTALAVTAGVALGFAVPGQSTVDVAAAKLDDSSTLEHLELKNGDELTGDVVSIDAKHVIIEHGSLGRREIPLGAVTGIVGRDVHLITSDGHEYDVTVESIADGKVVADDHGHTRAFELKTLRSEPTGIRWSGSLAIGTNLSIGNDEYAGANADLDLLAHRDHDRLKGKFDWAFRETKNLDNYQWSTTQRRTRGELQYDRYALADGFVWANSTALHDPFADIRLEWISGAGGGYDIVKGKALSLSATAGLAYVKKDYIEAEDREFAAGRGGVSFSWTPLKDVQFSQNSSVVPSLKNGDSSGDVIVHLDTRLRWKLIDKLFAQVRWVVDHNRAPSPGYKITDQTVALNFGWSF